MKKAAIVVGIVAAAFTLGVLWRKRGAAGAVMDEKIHDLQDHFKSLDAEAPAAAAR